jgi:hypothetical protein
VWRRRRRSDRGDGRDDRERVDITPVLREVRDELLRDRRLLTRQPRERARIEREEKARALVLRDAPSSSSSSSSE